ncbi:MAG: RNA polymerase primary sigma, partial [Chitinophagaceae bacterium]
FEREPTAQELADILELPVEEVSATMSAGIRHLSMDTPLADGEGSTIMDLMENTNAARTDEKLEHHESLHLEIERSLKTLTDRQKTVLCYFFGIGVDHALSLEDIGERFNLTRERVRQIKDKAITKLRSTKRSKYLRFYLG